MKSIVGIVLFCMISAYSYADGSISGNTSVGPNSIETYTVNWEGWDNTYEHYANVNWSVSGGTILSSDKHTITIQWDDIPTWMNSSGLINVSEDLSGQFAELSVDIINFVEGILESCNGVLGPAIITQNFGAGNNPGPPLPQGETNYDYNSICALTPGEYTRTNSTVNCRYYWLGLSEDHTPGDVNGYMLMFDGDNRRGEIYRTSISGANLNSVFAYELSVWVASLIGNGPRIEFEIQDGANNVLFQSGSYAVPYDQFNPWKKISLMVPIPSGVTTIQLVIINDNNDTGGNDFVIDDILFVPCYPPVIASFANNPSMVLKAYTCDNGTVNLFSWWSIPTTFTNPSFKWQRSSDNGATWANIPGATSMNYVQTENTAGVYWYRIMAYETSNPFQYLYSNALKYYVQKMVVNASTFNISGCTSVAVQLTPTFTLQYSDPSVSNLTYTFNWSPGTYLSSTTTQNPSATLPQLPPHNPPNPPNPPPPVNYNYTLTIQNSNYGCIGSNTQTVAHYNPRTVFLYNAFSPNGDGLNDYYRPINIQDYNLFGAEFIIYNRYGQIIFHRTSGTTLLDWSWDGKINGVLQPIGNYAFRLKIPGCWQNYIHGPNTVIQEDAATQTISGNFIIEY